MSVFLLAILEDSVISYTVFATETECIEHLDKTQLDHLKSRAGLCSQWEYGWLDGARGVGVVPLHRLW
jgi:hypothetical protein